MERRKNQDNGLIKGGPSDQVYIGAEPPRPGATEGKMSYGELNLGENPNIIERKVQRVPVHDSPGMPDCGAKGYTVVRSDLRPNYKEIY